MPHITPPPSPPNTFLWDIALIFWRMYIHWHMVASDISSVWLLGTHLAIPFQVLGNFCGECFQFFDTGNKRLQDIIAWINGIVDGNVLYRLMRVLFPHLREIVDNKLAWLESTIRTLSFDLYTIIINPWWWIREQLYDQTTWFWNFINNPSEFVLDRLVSWYSWLRDFFDRPIDYITWWSREAFDFIRQLELNPTNAVISWIMQWCSWFGDFLQRPEDYVRWWLTIINNELSPFLDNPGLWFRNLLGGYFLIRVQDWDDVYMRVIYVIIYKIKTSRIVYSGRLQDLIITVILWFM